MSYNKHTFSNHSVQKHKKPKKETHREIEQQNNNQIAYNSHINKVVIIYSHTQKRLRLTVAAAAAFVVNVVVVIIKVCFSASSSVFHRVFSPCAFVCVVVVFH